MKYLKLLYIIITIFIFHKGNAQQLERPIIISVSIDTSTNQTILNWEAANDSALVEYYSIYRHIISTGQRIFIANVPPDQRSYSFVSGFENSSSEFYTLIAEHSVIFDSPWAYSHSTIHSYIEFDTCNYSLNLKWSKYIDYTPNSTNKWKSVYYTVNQSIDGSSWSTIFDTIVTGNNPENFNLNLTQINENVNYCFYIEATNPISQKSFSNISCQYTKMNIRPDYINANYATVSSDNQIDLSFLIDPNSEINDFKLLRSSDGGNFFDTIQTVTTTERNLQFYDSDVNIATNEYLYQLIAINSCGNIAKRSNLAGNIVLNAENQGSINSLSWNDYQSWNGGLESYVVYRTIDNNTTDIITSTNTSYEDDIENFQNIQMSGQFCYYVEATESNNNPYGIKGISKSSTACITLDPVIVIPNAINPKSEIVANSCFKPFISYKPISYSLIIYNRWGGVVFESNDYLTGWDGLLKGNKYAPEGAYVYVIKVVKPNNEIITREGSLIIVYP